MFGECHAHMIMDGVCFREAAAKHRNGPDEALIDLINFKSTFCSAAAKD